MKALLFLLATTFALIVVSSCSNDKKPDARPERPAQEVAVKGDFDSFWKEFQSAAKSKNARSLSRLVKFPLALAYADGKLDERTFMANLNDYFDEDFVNALGGEPQSLIDTLSAEDYFFEMFNLSKNAAPIKEGDRIYFFSVVFVGDGDEEAAPSRNFYFARIGGEYRLFAIAELL
ncbi:MAG: hypothetical protein ACM3U1_03765 [Chloroflexota bacterium]